MPPPSSVVRLLHDQTIAVHGQLRLNRVPPLLARVVGLPLPFVFGSRYLLLRAIDYCLEAGEELLDLFQGPKLSRSLIDLLWQRQGLLHEMLYHPYVLEDVRLAQLEEESKEGRCDIQ